MDVFLGFFASSCLRKNASSAFRSNILAIAQHLENVFTLNGVIKFLDKPCVLLGLSLDGSL